ncbi:MULTISPECIES: TetR/AcrR family transcriptional regulator [Shewanella]|uniref:TetR/AcrR family transcriptional regulator n=1 Tax=Shewanella TaxID=22 RepID=UPI001C660527|nr:MULTISPECIES: TetR/AcrR family transcriptional regulator [Shewanella]QYJ74150.1 TetR/AcrR family transcriptional regulator [Shewanella sp. FJAT-52076]QYK04000.1 TetR/AcrR family transcriptional regulator [Shewanella zhangzhouensis]
MTSIQSSSPSRSEQKRSAILEAAIALFCAQGFPNTSMDEVAKKAGVSKQTVYAHFGNKDDLFVASIECKCDVHEIAPEMLADVAHPEQVLLQFASRFGDMIVSEEALTVYRACVSQSETHPEVSRLYFAGGPSRILAMLSDYFSRVEATGAFRFGDVRHAAIRLCLMLYGERRLMLELGLPLQETDSERARYLADTVKMFLAAAKS